MERGKKEENGAREKFGKKRTVGMQAEENELLVDFKRRNLEEGEGRKRWGGGEELISLIV